jgi:glutaconate CoA-transferase subunit A
VNITREGQNTLFQPPDPDGDRATFRNKSRALVSKLTTPREVVETLVRDGDYIAIGGFGANRISTPILHELVRQNRKNLGFAGHTSTHDFQVLVGGKCLVRCDVAYIVGLEARGLSPGTRRAVQNGEIALTEWTNAALSWRIKAAAMGIPFIPARSMLGTDTFNRSAAKAGTCPFTGGTYALLPALSPDFAAIHVHEADIYGNCRIRGASVSDADLARAAKRVVITAERIISTDEIRRMPEGTIIPYWCVDAVIPAPFGSYPGCMAGEYFSDEAHLLAWMKAEQDKEAFKDFLAEQILDSPDFETYLEKNGGLHRMKALHAEELLLKAED